MTNQIVEQLMLPDDHHYGHIDWKVFNQYVKLNGGWFKYVTVLCFLH